jgi:hypothetical protein
MQQLDIFDDGRDSQLAHALAEAVRAGDAMAALRAWRALQAEFPDDRHLPAASELLACLQADAQGGAVHFTEAEVARQDITDIEQTLEPAAERVLGATDARAWLAQRWRRLAVRCAGLAYRSDARDVHAAALWLRAGAWAEAAQAVQGIESWRRRPTPLGWMAQARSRLEGVDAAWPLVAELAWLRPDRLPGLVAPLPQPEFSKLARRFEAMVDADFDAAAPGDGRIAAANPCGCDDAERWAWWPAWLLVEQPLLYKPLSAAQPLRDSAAERAFQLMLALLHLERRGSHHELIAHRRQLHGPSPTLFVAYMATR